MTLNVREIEGAIERRKLREPGNIDEEKHYTICVGHHYAHTQIT